MHHWKNLLTQGNLVLIVPKFSLEVTTILVMIQLIKFALKVNVVILTFKSFDINLNDIILKI